MHVVQSPCPRWECWWMQCICKPAPAGALHYCVGVCVDVNGKLSPNQGMQSDPLLFLWLFFRARRAWPTGCLGMTMLLWEPECWIKSTQLLWEPASREFTLPSKPSVPGLGFYQIVFVIPLDFSNKQWNANICPEGKPPSYWRGKEHDIQMTHGFVGEVMAACHSLGWGFAVRCHTEWMYLGCEVNVNGFGRKSPVTSQSQFAC